MRMVDATAATFPVETYKGRCLYRHDIRRRYLWIHTSIHRQHTFNKSNGMVKIGRHVVRSSPHYCFSGNPCTMYVELVF